MLATGFLAVIGVAQMMCGAGDGIGLEVVRKAEAVVLVAAGGAVRCDREWDGVVCRARIVNGGTEAARVVEAVLFDVDVNLPPETPLYGEGFTMLAQNVGTLGSPRDLTGLTDRGHYRIPQPEGTAAFYGMMALSPAADRHIVIGFTSCRRFVGKFLLKDGRLKAVVDTEGLALAPGEAWDLEGLAVIEDTDLPSALSKLAGFIEKNHPRLPWGTPPRGWCSWYCFGPMVTAKQVMANADFIAANIPELEYIQIDDGYQAAMGDWLDTGRAFGGDIKGVLKAIRDRGLKPAIWVAPFVAEEKSRVFREHPDWFVKDESGQPLRSDKVTFGGWRCGPWYALDGTHPEAQQHLENVFRTMRNEWGCGYFKLDANFWGAIHGGRFHDPKATRVEAYRRGMAAVLRGAGDAFVLGCNHPLWPSFGLIHGSRSSNDAGRSWDSFRQTAYENLLRNWQNGRLWWNDPDCVLLTGKLPENEFMYHAASVYASGGMVLSGDDLTRISPERLAILRTLATHPGRGIAARFADIKEPPRVGVVQAPGGDVVCLLNDSDAPRAFTYAFAEGPVNVTDLWRGAAVQAGVENLMIELPPHAAGVYGRKPAERK